MSVEIGTLVLAISAAIGISLIWLAVEKIVWLLKKPAERAVIDLERNFKQQCEIGTKYIIQRKKDEEKHKNCIGYFLTDTPEEFEQKQRMKKELAIMASIKQREELAKYKKKYPNEFKE